MKKEGFLKIPNWFYEDGHMAMMGATTFIVYTALLRHANSITRECNPSYSKISINTGVSRRSISNALEYLTKHGYIHILKTGNATQKSSIYKVSDFDEINNQDLDNWFHMKLVKNKTSFKSDGELVSYETATSFKSDSELVSYETQNIQSRNIQIEKDKEEKDAETFFSDSLNQNQAMQEVKTSNDGMADQENPIPLSPAPSVKPFENYSQKMEDRFNNKLNRFEPKGLTKNDYGDWHLGEVKGGSKLDSYNNWKPSLIIAAQNRKRIWKQPETVTAAAQYIRNVFEKCRDKDDWADFESLITEAIAYEQALASNPTQSQDIEPTEPIVYDHHYPWQHFYPMKGKVNPKGDEAEIIWGMINSRPPDPVDERCQKFLVKANGDIGRLTKLLKATHTLDPDVASYEIQANDFANAIDGLIATLNQEIQKLLASQAA